MLKTFSCFLYALLLGSFLLTSSVQAQWVLRAGADKSLDIWCFISHDSTLFAGSKGPLRAPGTATWYVPVLRSTDQGASWALCDSEQVSDSTLNAPTLAFHDSVLFAGGVYGIHRSRDNGRTWEWADSGLTDPYVNSVLVRGSTIYAATGAEGTNLRPGFGNVFRSTDDGTSWTKVSSGLPVTQPIFSLTSIDSAVCAVVMLVGLYSSTDEGENWRLRSWDLSTANSFAASASGIFAGTDYGGVLRSTDGGVTWVSVDSGLTDPFVYAIGARDSILVAGTFSHGVFKSTNSGKLWEAINDGLPASGQTVGAVFFNGEDVFIQCDGGIWSRPLAELTTRIGPRLAHAPSTFSLQQNYPNPFNPTTTIRYALPQRTHVTLSAYNMLGELLSTIVNEEEQAGEHEVKFDGARLASGVYFYRLQAGSFVKTRTLLLLR